MRIKFEKGLTPEAIAEHLINIIRDNYLVIGSVNVYIQTYDENMVADSYKRGDDYLIVKPCKESKEEYADDVVRMRRERLKVV